MTIIFEEQNTSKNVKYDVKGCEKVVVMRTDAPPGNVTLNIETLAGKDPNFRPVTIGTISDNQDFCLPCLACGMNLLFRLNVNTTPPEPRVHVEILDETCVPQSCCQC